MLHYAYRKKIINENVIDLIERKIKGVARRKEILLLEEISILANTPIKSDQIKRAFLFSTLTGLRWVDIKKLTWDRINFENKTLNIRQSKTGVDVAMHLNSASLSLLDNKGLPNELVFDLPTADGANKTVKAWVKRAKINKHITWHNARHSFGTNLILMGEDPYNTQTLMGQSTIQQIERYIKGAKEIKLMGTEKININLNTSN